MCLRFDFLKTLNIQYLSDVIEKERKGAVENNTMIKYLIK